MSSDRKAAVHAAVRERGTPVRIHHALCDDGTAVCTEWHNFKVEGRAVRCLIRKDDKLEGVAAGNGFTKTMARRRSETGEGLPIEVGRGDKTAFYRNFVEAVRGREALTIKRGEIERVFKLMELAKLSADKKEVIKETF